MQRPWYYTSIVYLIAALLKKPILCSNANISYILLGIAFLRVVSNGISAIGGSIIVFLMLSLPSVVISTLLGITYYLHIDLDSFKEEMHNLGFSQEEYIGSGKILQFASPNGTKVLASKPTHKLIEISIVNGIRFHRINETRKTLSHLIKRGIKEGEPVRRSYRYFVIGIFLFSVSGIF